MNYYTPQQIESAIKYIFGVDTQLISDQTYYIAEVGDQIVGCGGWSKRKTMFGGDQMKAEQDPLLNAAMGYEVTNRFEQPMTDGTTLPLAYMKKQLV
jgi:hypothetical protein